MKSPRNRRRPQPRTPRGPVRAGIPVVRPVVEQDADEQAAKPRKAKGGQKPRKAKEKPEVVDE